MQIATHRLIFALLIMLLFAAACQSAAPAPTIMPTPTNLPVPEPTPESDPPAAAPPPLDETELTALGQAQDEAQNIIVEALAVDPDAVTILAVEAVNWNDSSLGCPQPDMMYAQVITPGYRVTVEVAGKQHEVHMNSNGFGVVCGH